MSATLQPVAIGGVDSPYIKGIYKPSTTETQGGKPVYNKRDSDAHKLIFDPKSSKWKIKEKRTGNEWVTIAKVKCSPPTAPEHIKECWDVRSENSRGFRYIPTKELKVATRQGV
jgi:hypothetical protein